MTVLEVLQSTAAYFGRKGIDQPRLNIEHLLAEALGKRRLDLYLEFDRPLTAAELDVLREKVRRRADREPLQHVLGHWDFFGRTFATDARALVPRPETELLVEEALRGVAGDGAGALAIDVGTGSGIIGVTLALERPALRVLAVDRMAAALALAAENARRHQVENRVEFKLGDLLQGVTGPADLIVANLPYIPTRDLSSLPAEVRRDPASALDGGADGLRLIWRLAAEAPAVLRPGGSLLVEVGDGQAPAVEALLRSENFRDIYSRSDYQGIVRVLGARYG